MTLNGNVLISVNFSFFNITHYHSQVGYLSYRASIYQTDSVIQNEQKKYGKVLGFMEQPMDYRPQLKEHNLTTMRSYSQPFISQQGLKFCSRQIEVNHVNRDFVQNYTCEWEIQINNDKIDDLKLFIQVELLFREKSLFWQETKIDTYNNNCTVIQTFKARINKAYNVYSFLPIQFDYLGTLKLNAMYLSVVKSFQFIPSSKNRCQEQGFFSSMNQFFKRFFLNDQKEKSEQRVLIKRKYFLSIQRKFIKRYQISLIFLPFQYHLTMYQFFIHIQVLSRKVTTFYTFYRSQLKNSYNWMQKLYFQITQNNNIHVNEKKSNNNSFKEILKINQQNQLAFNEQFDSMYRHHQNLNQFQQSTKKITEIIQKDLLLLQKPIYQFFNRINKLILSNSLKITKQKSINYNKILQKRYKNNILSHQIIFEKEDQIDHTFSRYDESGLSNLKCVDKENDKTDDEDSFWKGLIQIEDIRLYNNHRFCKIFQEIYQTKRDFNSIKKNSQKTQKLPTKSSEHEKKNIIFLVHGFGASRIDMMLLKKTIQVHSKAQVIISLENIGKTQDYIEIQGERLANQVEKYIHNEKSQNFKISFIGHSLGGLVIRSAMNYLQEYKQHFRSYISICTPHLGYLYSPCRLTSIGMWLISKFQDCNSLKQLMMRDSFNNLRESTLYKMSKNGSLNHFKHVAFLASTQDSYVPYESSRLQKSQRLLSQMRQNNEIDKADIIEQMVDNILKGIKSTQKISRMNVIFNLEDKQKIVNNQFFIEQIDRKVGTCEVPFR